MSEDSFNLWHWALECAGHGVWDWHVPTSSVFFSDSLICMLGYNPGDFTNSLDEWYNRVHPEDLPSVLEEINRHFRGETDRYINEHRLRCKDGTWKWILDQGQVVRYEPDGSPSRMIGTHTDISKQKQAEKQCQELQRKFDHFMEFAPLQAWASSRDGRLLYCNSPFAALVQKTKSNLTNTSLYEIFPKKMADEFVENNLRVIESGIPLETIEEAPRPQGDIGTFLVVKFPIDNVFEHDRVAGGFACDISELKRQEVEIRDALNKAELASRAKDFFLATTSHELRTPLHTILGHNELLLESEAEGPRRQRLLIIQSAAENLLQLIDDILDTTSISQGAIKITSHPTKLVTLIEHVKSLHETQLSTKGIEFICEIDPRIPEYVTIDGKRLRQTLVNLTSNALKFTNEGNIRTGVWSLNPAVFSYLACACLL